MSSSHCPCCGFPLDETPVDTYENTEPVADRILIDYDYTFGFGKYRGRAVPSVLTENPSYFVWLNQNASDNYLIDNKLLSDAQQKIPKRRYGPRDDYDYDDPFEWEDYLSD